MASMPNYLLLAAISLAFAYFLQVYRNFQDNLEAAERSGIPYIVSPIYVFNRYSKPLLTE